MIYKLANKSPEEVMSIVRELRKKGLLQGTDFDFKYEPTQWDPVTRHMIEGPHAVFTFHNEKEGLLFALKWT